MTTCRRWLRRFEEPLKGLPGPKVAVIGGGVSGLSACYHLEKLGAENVFLFEASERLGGKVRTVEEAGFRIECGPDSIFTRQPDILQLIDELGLRDEIIEPATRGFSIWIDGGLRVIPSGLTRVGSIDAFELERFLYLSEESKREVSREAEVPPNLDEDESVRDFFSRRFGAEYSARIAEPLFAGTHGGDPQLLSMQSLFPSYRENERKFGSLSRAAKEGAMSSIAKFISFKGGTEALTKKLADSLKRTSLKRNFAVGPVAAEGQGFRVAGESFDLVIITTPAAAASRLLGQAAPGTAELLSEIKAASSSIVTFSYRVAPGELHGTGFLVPPHLDEGVTGATWSSQKWNDRSPAGEALIRVFLRGTPDDAVRLARQGLEEMAGIDAEPTFGRVDRWPDGLPQYRVGHGALVREIATELAKVGKIFLAGQSYRGVGIPDCVRQGREAAEMAINA